MSGEGNIVNLFQRIVDLFEDSDVEVRNNEKVYSLIKR